MFHVVQITANDIKTGFMSACSFLRYCLSFLCLTHLSHCFTSVFSVMSIYIFYLIKFILHLHLSIACFMAKYKMPECKCGHKFKQTLTFHSIFYQLFMLHLVLDCCSKPHWAMSASGLGSYRSNERSYGNWEWVVKYSL